MEIEKWGNMEIEITDEHKPDDEDGQAWIDVDFKIEDAVVNLRFFYEYHKGDIANMLGRLRKLAGKA